MEGSSWEDQNFQAVNLQHLMKKETKKKLALFCVLHIEMVKWYGREMKEVV